MNLSFQNVDSFCANIDLSQERPVVDLSQLNFIEPFAVIYLGQFLRYHNRLGRFFDVDLPKQNAQVRRYLARIRFWERFKFTREMVEREGMLRFTSNTSLNDIVELTPYRGLAEDSESMVQEVLAAGQRTFPANEILEATLELVDNFALHAEVDLATLAVQYFPTRKEFALAVGDSGVGIRATLCENPKFAHLAQGPHREAILKALEPTVSRSDQAGTGLTIVRNNVLAVGGNLRIASNDGFVYIDNQGTRIGNQKYDLPGVQMELRFPERG